VVNAAAIPTGDLMKREGKTAVTAAIKT